MFVDKVLINVYVFLFMAIYVSRSVLGGLSILGVCGIWRSLACALVSDARSGFLSVLVSGKWKTRNGCGAE